MKIMYIYIKYTCTYNMYFCIPGFFPRMERQPFLFVQVQKLVSPSCFLTCALYQICFPPVDPRWMDSISMAPCEHRFTRRLSMAGICSRATNRDAEKMGGGFSENNNNNNKNKKNKKISNNKTKSAATKISVKNNDKF